MNRRGGERVAKRGRRVLCRGATIDRIGSGRHPTILYVLTEPSVNVHTQVRRLRRNRRVAKGAGCAPDGRGCRVGATAAEGLQVWARPGM